MNAINLIPRYRIEARQRRRRVRAWCVGAGVYTLALLAGCLALVTVWGNPDRVVTDELARVDRLVVEARKQMASVGPELAEAKVQLEASRAVSAQPDWSLLLGLLGELRGETVSLKAVTLTPAVSAPSPVKETAPAGRLGLAADGDDPAADAPKPAHAPNRAEPEPARKPLCFRLTIEGVADSQFEASRFVLRLEQVKLFDEVKLVETSRVASGEGNAT